MRRRRIPNPTYSLLAVVLITALALLYQRWMPSQDDFVGNVVGVSDGDTIEVMRSGRAERVRLYGVDSPERRQPFSSRAKQFTSSLVFGKTVRVRIRDTDQLGRIVAEVYLPDGRSLNQELVRAGYAWWFRRYSDDPTLQRLEQEARRARRGLWADNNPVPPWEFRRDSRLQRTR